jgi:hypothetical protein
VWLALLGATGMTGATGPVGAQGPAGVGSSFYEVAVTGGGTTTVVTATCNAGDVVTGGGYSQPGNGGILSTYPTNGNAWTVVGYSGTVAITVYAICAHTS